MVRHLTDERRLDVEQPGPLAEQAGLPMTHLAMAFTITHPGVTSALLGARTMNHLDDLLAGLDVTLTDDILDRIDEIVPAGTDVGTLDQAYQPPSPADSQPATPTPDRTRRGLTTDPAHQHQKGSVTSNSPAAGPCPSIRRREHLPERPLQDLLRSRRHDLTAQRLRALIGTTERLGSPTRRAELPDMSVAVGLAGQRRLAP
jgi:hypothetical protein